MSALRVKICGITNLADAEAAVQCGANALGLNFYAHSPRYVPVEKAAGSVGAKNRYKSVSSECT